LNDRINRLEEKVAYLERHVTEQDKAMLEMSEDIAKLRCELSALRDRSARPNATEADEAADERPPHY
jgi:SlyX protein